MEIEALPLEELPDGSMRLVPADGLTIGLYHCQGALHAIEDRCTHDDGPLCEGDWDGEACEVVFTLRRQPSMTDADFAEDAAAVARDLVTLRRVLESARGSRDPGSPQ